MQYMFILLIYYFRKVLLKVRVEVFGTWTKKAVRDLVLGFCDKQTKKRTNKRTNKPASCENTGSRAIFVEIKVKARSCGSIWKTKLDCEEGDGLLITRSARSLVGALLITRSARSLVGASFRYEKLYLVVSGLGLGF